MTIDKSLAMQTRAREHIPGGVQLLSKRPDQFSRGVWPGYFSKAKGIKVWDLDGNAYRDMSIGGIGATVLGYADDEVDDAVVTAIRHGVASSLNAPEEVELAELLCELHPWADQVRFARTGGESLAIAIRISRAYTGRDTVAFCGYHGWHDWYLAANLHADSGLDGHLLPGLEPNGVPRGLTGTALGFRYNRIDELKAIVSSHRNSLAAVILEPIRSDSPAEGFYEQLLSLAHDAGAVVIADEVSSGFRMITGGAHMALGLEPDMAVFSKALGNGYAIGAVVGRRKVMDAAQSTFISSTNWTERVGFAAALATIGKHRREQAGDHLMAIGRRVQEGWLRAAAAAGLQIQVGGIPPLSHFSLPPAMASVGKAYFVQEMLKRGFLASTSFYSMLAHSESDVDDYLAEVEEVFQVISDRRDKLQKDLEGEPAAQGFARLT